MPEDKFILLKIEGKFVNIMYKVNPKHKKNVRVENGVKVKYIRLMKYLYGCMESALFWYDLYSNIKVLWEQTVYGSSAHGSMLHMEYTLNCKATLEAAHILDKGWYIVSPASKN